MASRPQLTFQGICIIKCVENGVENPKICPLRLLCSFLSVQAVSRATSRMPSISQSIIREKNKTCRYKAACRYLQKLLFVNKTLV